MKDIFVKIILISIVFLNILDGDFNAMNKLDYVKFALLIVCFALSLLPQKKKVKE